MSVRACLRPWNKHCMAYNWPFTWDNEYVCITSAWIILCWSMESDKYCHLVSDNQLLPEQHQPRHYVFYPILQLRWSISQQFLRPVHRLQPPTLRPPSVFCMSSFFSWVSAFAFIFILLQSSRRSIAEDFWCSGKWTIILFEISSHASCLFLICTCVISPVLDCSLVSLD